VIVQAQAWTAGSVPSIELEHVGGVLRYEDQRAVVLVVRDELGVSPESLWSSRGAAL